MSEDLSKTGHNSRYILYRLINYSIGYVQGKTLIRFKLNINNLRLKICINRSNY